jgi:hypothetical protein
VASQLARLESTGFFHLGLHADYKYQIFPDFKKVIPDDTMRAACKMLLKSDVGWLLKTKDNPSRTIHFFTLKYVI